MSGAKNLKKGELLFKEGDTPEAMYVIKSGKITITKAKGQSEITLAELGPGDMVGEMAFFDSKPRSAGARAAQDTVIIELPFRALNAQLQTMPEWLKAIMRTVNNHLRNANQKIKNLEKSDEEETSAFPPHLINRLMAILGFISNKYGEKSEEGLLIPPGRLRNYTIQVFQQPTNKMQKLMEILQAFRHMKIEEIGEGRQKLTVLSPDLFLGFVDFYNDYLFKDESKRVSMDEKDMKTLQALIFYGKKQTPDAKGIVKVNLTSMQNDSMRDLGFLFSVDDVNNLCEKGLLTDKVMRDGFLETGFELKQIETIYPYWELIFALKKIKAV